MHPVRLKMNSGATYLGFIEEDEEWGVTHLVAGCSMSFSKAEYRYDVVDIMDPVLPVELNFENVSIHQKISDDTEVALVYCSYLGTWISMMEANGFSSDIPDFVRDYIEGMNPRFIERNAGVDIYLKGKYGYGMSIQDPHVDVIQAQIQKIQASFLSPAPERKPCDSKVVTVDFNSKKP